MLLRIYIFFLLIFALPNLSSGQLKITWPLVRSVFQRNSSDQAEVYLSGYSALPFDRLEWQLIDDSGKRDWKKLVFSGQNGTFLGKIVVDAGWYELKLRGFLKDSLITEGGVDKFGVGEVFLVAGQSNAMGIQGLGAKNATETVNVFNVLNKKLDESENLTISINQPSSFPVFQQAYASTNIYPTGESSWIWGELGDLIASQRKLPVLFFNCGWAAASSQNWSESADSLPTLNNYIGKNWSNLQPYANLKNSLRNLHTLFGLRSVLWQHGESDAAHFPISAKNYQKNVQNVINRSREHLNWNISWAIARSTISADVKQPNMVVIDAQTALINVSGNNTFAGPNTDVVLSPRPAHGHFENIKGGIQGITQAAELWNKALDDNFYRQSKPFIPQKLIIPKPLPQTISAGKNFNVFFQHDGFSSKSFIVQLLGSDGNYLAELGKGAESPIQVKIPLSFVDGIFKIRVVSYESLAGGVASNDFAINPQSSALIDFQGKKTGKNNLLGWMVSRSDSIRKLIVQRSVDGKNFKDAAEVTVVKSAEIQQYSWTEENPVSNMVYFRLKITGIDNADRFSEIRKLPEPEKVLGTDDIFPADLILFPNPVKGRDIFLNNRWDKPSFLLYDISGKEIAELNTFSRINDQTRIVLPLGLPFGMYILKLIISGKSKDFKFWYNQ